MITSLLSFKNIGSFLSGHRLYYQLLTGYAAESHGGLTWLYNQSSIGKETVVFKLCTVLETPFSILHLVLSALAVNQDYL